MPSDEPVRIGLPLDGWHLAVVDPATGVARGGGGIGELVIGGVGTARYLDREKDAAKFTPLLALDWDRAYRSGDLVRADPEGLSFIGRADTQVKIRGFRIELSEIEAVLLQMPGVGQAVVSTYESAPGLTELVAYYSPVPGSAVDAEGIRTTLRNRLPGHMVPGYVEQLAEIPMMTSGKADRKALPAAPATQRRRLARGLRRAGGPGRDRPGRRARRDRRAGQGLGGEPLLRRPGRELADARPVLREGPQGGRPPARRDAGRVPEPDRPARSPPRCRTSDAPATGGRAASRPRCAARRHAVVRLLRRCCSCW